MLSLSPVVSPGNPRIARGGVDIPFRAEKRRRAVVIYDNGTDSGMVEHVRVTLDHVGGQLAYLLGYDYLGLYDPRVEAREPLFFVPRETLLADEARALGIHSRDDLFGGIVPFPVMRTKAIAHSLFDADAVVPPGWRPELAAALEHVTLPGWSAFTKRDARRAARAMLSCGPVRLKAGAGVGGLGQWTSSDERGIDGALDEMRDADLAANGVVIESNLSRPFTYGIGQVHLGDQRYSYCGTQRTTRNHARQDVYAGSDLTVVRGDFDALLSLRVPPDIKLAIRQAKAFDAATRATIPGLLVSRNNYDVIQGCDAAERPFSGVLEQSWRIGGASPAEIAAIEAFDRNPALRLVRVSTFEHYGAIEPPRHARIHYSGVDPRVGQITKFTLIEADEHTAAVI